MLPGAVWSREKSSTALVRAKSKSWATTTIIGTLLYSVGLLEIRDPVSWEGFSLPTRYALQLEKRPPRISKWKCLSMLLKPVSLGCLVGTNHSSRPPSRLCVSTTFQPPGHLESFLTVTALCTGGMYAPCASFSSVVSYFSFIVCRVFRLWLIIAAQILAPEFSSPPQPRVALPSRERALSEVLYPRCAAPSESHNCAAGWIGSTFCSRRWGGEETEDKKKKKVK